jgi:hypothetical protein
MFSTSRLLFLSTQQDGCPGSLVPGALELLPCF